VAPQTPLYLPETKELVIANEETNTLLFLSLEGEVKNIILGRDSVDHVSKETLEALGKKVNQTRIGEAEAEITRLQDAIGEQERILGMSLGAAAPAVPTIRLITEEVRGAYVRARKAGKERPEDEAFRRIAEKELAKLIVIEEKAIQDPETAWEEFQAKVPDFLALGEFLQTHQSAYDILKPFMDRVTELRITLERWRTLPPDQKAREVLVRLYRKLLDTESTLTQLQTTEPLGIVDLTPLGIRNPQTPLELQDGSLVVPDGRSNNLLVLDAEGNLTRAFTGVKTPRSQIETLKRRVGEKQVVDLSSLGLHGPQTPLELQDGSLVMANDKSDTLLILDEWGNPDRAYISTKTEGALKETLKEKLGEEYVMDFSSFGIHFVQPPLQLQDGSLVLANPDNDILLFLDEAGNPARAYIGAKTLDFHREALKERIGEKQVVDLTFFGLGGPETPLELKDGSLVVANPRFDTLLLVDKKGKPFRAYTGVRTVESLKGLLKERLGAENVIDLSSFGLYGPHTPLQLQDGSLVVPNHFSDTLLFLDEKGKPIRAYMGGNIGDTHRQSLRKNLGKRKLTDLSSFGFLDPLTPIQLQDGTLVVANALSHILLFLSPEGEVNKMYTGRGSSNYVTEKAVKAVRAMSKKVHQIRIREVKADITRLQDAIGEQERILGLSLGQLEDSVSQMLDNTQLMKEKVVIAIPEEMIEKGLIQQEELNYMMNNSNTIIFIKWTKRKTLMDRMELLEREGLLTTDTKNFKANTGTSFEEIGKRLDQFSEDTDIGREHVIELTLNKVYQNARAQVLNSTDLMTPLIIAHYLAQIEGQLHHDELGILTIENGQFVATLYDLLADILIEQLAERQVAIAA